MTTTQKPSTRDVHAICIVCGKGFFAKTYDNGQKSRTCPNRACRTARRAPEERHGKLARWPLPEPGSDPVSHYLTLHTKGLI